MITKSDCVKKCHQAKSILKLAANPPDSVDRRAMTGQLNTPQNAPHCHLKTSKPDILSTLWMIVFKVVSDSIFAWGELSASAILHCVKANKTTIKSKYVRLEGNTVFTHTTESLLFRNVVWPQMNEGKLFVHTGSFVMYKRYSFYNILSIIRSFKHSDFIEKFPIKCLIWLPN